MALILLEIMKRYVICDMLTKHCPEINEYKSFNIYLVISEVVFDKRINCMDKKNLDIVEFVNAVNNFTVYAGRLLFQMPLWKIYPTKDWKLFLKSTKLAYE